MSNVENDDVRPGTERIDDMDIAASMAALEDLDVDMSNEVSSSAGAMFSANQEEADDEAFASLMEQSLESPAPHTKSTPVPKDMQVMEHSVALTQKRPPQQQYTIPKEGELGKLKSMVSQLQQEMKLLKKEEDYPRKEGSVLTSCTVCGREVTIFGRHVR